MKDGWKIEGEQDMPCLNCGCRDFVFESLDDRGKYYCLRCLANLYNNSESLKKLLEKWEERKDEV